MYSRLENFDSHPWCWMGGRVYRVGSGGGGEKTKSLQSLTKKHRFITKVTRVKTRNETKNLRSDDLGYNSSKISKSGALLGNTMKAPRLKIGLFEYVSGQRF